MRSMKTSPAQPRRGGGALVGAALLAMGLVAMPPASAAPPEIRLTAANRVPGCVTPERLMQFTAMRNPALAPRFRNIAWAYQRHGEVWRVRWDYAFYQMLVETNFLAFRRADGHRGEVHPSQNNFAGLGATGGLPGDAFPDVSTGVLAQIQHLVVYSGEPLSAPVAPRTRLKMGEILKKSRALGRPVTFADLSRRWAVDAHYARSIETVAQGYRELFCGRHEEQRRRLPPRLPHVSMARPPVEDVEERRIVRQRVDKRPLPPRTTAAVTPPSIKAPSTIAASKDKSDSRSTPTTRQEAVTVPPASVKTSSVPERKSEPAPPKAPDVTIAPVAPSAPRVEGQCKVFTASYGGGVAILIASDKDGLTTYTVLEVVEQRREPQIKAYVDLHAKGGQVLGEFKKREDALAMAFTLCPKE
jgi:hypothetical protein